MNNVKNNNIYFLIGTLVILILWQSIGALTNNSIILPKIDEVLVSLVTLLITKSTYIIIFNTVLRLLITTIISFVISLILACLSLISNKLYHFIKPFIILIKTIPIATIIILLLMAFGQEVSPYIICSFVIIPIMYEGIFTSINLIDKNIIDEVKTISNLNYDVFKLVFIPLSSPYIIATIIQSLGLGFKVMVMAEVISQPRDTIGYQIALERIYLQTANIFSWTIILIVFVIAVEFFIRRINKRIHYMAQY